MVPLVLVVGIPEGVVVDQVEVVGVQDDQEQMTGMEMMKKKVMIVTMMMRMTLMEEQYKIDHTLQKSTQLLNLAFVMMM